MDFKRIGGLMEENNTKVIDYTELLEQILAEEQAQTETLVGIRDEFADVDESIGGLEIMFGAVVVFAILDFCWSCMRQWRKNILKMGE